MSFERAFSCLFLQHNVTDVEFCLFRPVRPVVKIVPAFL